MKCQDCGAEGTSKAVSWPERGEGPYRMCDPCAWHSVKNRGASELTGFADIFSFDDWFAVPDGRGCIDWDCDFYYLVITAEGDIQLHRAGCQSDEERIRKMFPNAVMREQSLGRHRGKLEGAGDLAKTDPELHKKLGQWCQWKEVA